MVQLLKLAFCVPAAATRLAKKKRDKRQKEPPQKVPLAKSLLNFALNLIPFPRPRLPDHATLRPDSC